MKYQLLILGLFFLASCVPSKTEEKVTSGNINTLAPYLWNDKAFPKTLRVSSDFTAAEVTNISDMSTAWQTAMNNTIFFSYGAVTPEISNNVNNLDTMYDNVMGVYKTTSWPDSLPTSALAVTQIFGRRYNTGAATEFVNIEHADIMVNYEIFNFDTADTGTGYDLRTVVLHEMGHFMGLQHNTTVPRAQSVMYPSISSSEAKRVPQLADTNELANKYGIQALGASGGSALVAVGPRGHVVDESKPHSPLKIVIELHANGDCVHKENGVQIERHHVDLKN